jgi:hypothetical protein
MQFQNLLNEYQIPKQILIIFDEVDNFVIDYLII